jgi:tetratricopeptide (TPR) repeat protein
MTSRPTAEHAIPSIDPGLFWMVHKSKIIAGTAALTLFLIGFGAYLGFKAVQNQRAEAAFAAADSIDGWRSVIAQFPGSVAAGNAYLRIAAKQMEGGKYSDSDTAYESFVHQLPKHPLVVNGYLGLAQNAEAEKDLDKALQYYTQVATQFGYSYAGPIALFHQGRITEAKGQLQAARAILESVVQRYPDSFAAALAGHEAARLAEKLASKMAKPGDMKPNISPASQASPAASASGTPAIPAEQPAKP